MKWIFIFLILIACGERSHQPSADVSPTNKKLEAGQSLIFSCDNPYKQTKITILFNWTGDEWQIAIEERNLSGQFLGKVENLVGKPDEVESLHINITQEGADYARLIQVGEYEARYRDSAYTLTCKF